MTYKLNRTGWKVVAVSSAIISLSLVGPLALGADAASRTRTCAGHSRNWIRTHRCVAAPVTTVDPAPTTDPVSTTVAPDPAPITTPAPAPTTAPSTTAPASTTVPPPATTPPPPSPGNSTDTNCAAVPSRCGYPDATNTGPAPGTVLKRVPQDLKSGPGWAWESDFQRLRVTGSGAVLNGLNVSGPVVIDAPNVTLSNSIVNYCDVDGDIVAIRAGSPTDGYIGDNATINHNRLFCDQPTTNRSRSGVRDVYGEAKGVRVTGNEITGTGNGITLEYEGVATDNWIHDLGHLSGDHHSGVSTHGGAKSIVFSHNTLLLANTSTSGGGGLSGAITSYGDFGHAQNMTAQDNLISGGAYTVYGGINNEATYGNPTNINFLNNRFVCGSWVYGPAFLRSGPTNHFTGNICDATLATVNP